MLRIVLQGRPEVNQTLIKNAADAENMHLGAVETLIFEGEAVHIRKGAFSGLPNL